MRGWVGGWVRVCVRAVCVCARARARRVCVGSFCGGTSFCSLRTKSCGSLTSDTSIPSFTMRRTQSTMYLNTRYHEPHVSPKTRRPTAQRKAVHTPTALRLRATDSGARQLSVRTGPHRRRRRRRRAVAAAAGSPTFAQAPASAAGPTTVPHSPVAPRNRCC